MSLILDALRKADAQRERDPSRGIHAQAGVEPAPLSSAARPRWLIPAGLALGALIALGATWSLWPRGEAGHGVAVAQVDGQSAPAASDASKVPTAPSAAPASASASATVRVADVISPPAPPPAPPPARQTALPPRAGDVAAGVAGAGSRAAPGAAARGGEGRSARSQAASQGASALAQQSGAAPAASAASGAPAPADSVSAAASGPSVPVQRVAPAAPAMQAPGVTQTQPMAANPGAAAPRAMTAPGATASPPPTAAASPLPADAPKVSITGGVYSASPARRMLIVNGQVHGEGSEAAPGVVIDEIQPNRAVLRFRGQRYNAVY